MFKFLSEFVADTGSGQKVLEAYVDGVAGVPARFFDQDS